MSERRRWLTYPSHTTLVTGVRPARHGIVSSTAPEEPDLHTGLVMSGSGVRRGASLGVVEMIDVAPTVAALLDLSLEVAEGEPIREALAGREM